MNALSIHIPEPCHEDWQQMTPVDKGRFCQSCAKQVVDFSAMTDQEILRYISKASGGLCGRFADDQLQRPLLPVKQEKKRVWWMAAAMPLLMLFERGHAQGKNTVPVKQEAAAENWENLITGKMLAQPAKHNASVNGQVINDQGKPVPFATILLNGKNIGVSADSAGKFTLSNFKNSGTNFLQVSAVGYEPTEALVENNQSEYIVTLKPSENKLAPIVVSSSDLATCSRTLGGMWVTHRYRKTVKDSIGIFFAGPVFKIFPNPARRGSGVNIDVKAEGFYSIQLFDNNGKLVRVKQFDAAEGAMQTSLEIPSSLAAGMYYIRLVNEKNKKEYTDKIVLE